MEKKGKFGSDWVEGFAKQAMDLGAGPEQVKELLKTAAQLEQMKDPKFFEGVQSVLEKTAGMDKEALLGKVLKYMSAKPLRAALGTAGLGAAGLGAHNLWNRHVNRGPMDQRMMDLMGMAEQGTISYDDAIGHGRRQYMDQAKRRLKTMGAKDNSDGYSQWYNFG